MTITDATTSPAGRPDGAACIRLRTYVIDTSVLLSDPWALLKFAEHKVVLPVVVVSELEGKRQHPELGWFARQALNLLEDFRRTEGRLDRDIRSPRRAAPCGSNSTTPMSPYFPRASGSRPGPSRTVRTTTGASSPAP